jgi:hypothetical protein
MILQHILVNRAKITSPKKEDHMNASQILVALAAYLSGAGSFRIGKRTVSLANTGTNAVKFTFATALKAAEEAALLDAATGTVYPVTVVVGSTSITVS